MLWSVTAPGLQIFPGKVPCSIFSSHLPTHPALVPSPGTKPWYQALVPLTGTYVLVFGCQCIVASVKIQVVLETFALVSGWWSPSSRQCFQTLWMRVEQLTEESWYRVLFKDVLQKKL